MDGCHAVQSQAEGRKERSKRKKQSYRVTDWSGYNLSLKKRW